MRRIVTRNLKALAVAYTFAFAMISFLQSCEGRNQTTTPLAIASPSALPTIPDVLTEPSGKAPPQP
jgi:hypothetical protein